MHLNSLMSYPIWTLLCAIFFPSVAAIAAFLCLRRAGTAKKLIAFFTVIPIYAGLTVVFLGDTANLMTDLLASAGLPNPPAVGFICALTLGVFCLDMIALICGTELFRTRGAVTNAISTVIFLCANIYITYGTWVQYIEMTADGMNRKDGGVIYIGEILPFVNEIGFLKEYVADCGTEMLSIALLALYLIVYFLSFTALRSPEEIAKEELERKRLALLAAKKKEPIQKSAPAEDEHLPVCCAFCEHATPLKGDKLKLVCDTCGVVSSSHSCRKFLYDPLKRTAPRPRIDPISDDTPPLDLNHI